MLTERALRAFLLLFGAYHVLTGGLALIDPGTFFDQIGKYAPENDHYVGDVGAFTIAAGIALIAAAQRPSWRVPVLALVALWYAFHAVNHAFDIDQARTDARGLVDTLLLALGAAVTAWVAREAARLDRAGG